MTVLHAFVAWIQQNDILLSVAVVGGQSGNAKK